MAYIKERGNNNYFVRVSCGTLDNGRPFQKSRLFRPSRVNLPESKVRKELDTFVKVLEEECRIEFESKRQPQTNFELSKGKTKQEPSEEQVKGDHQSMITPINASSTPLFADSGQVDKKGEKLAPATRYLTILQSIMTMAWKQEYINSNPADTRRLEISKIVTPEVEAFSNEEIAEILKMAQLEPIHIHAVIATAIYTGARRGEIAGLKWGDIDFEKRTMYIRRSVVKLAKQEPEIKLPKTISSIRQIAIPQALCDILQELKKEQDRKKALLGEKWHEEGFLFTDWCGHVMHPHTPTKQFDKFLKKYGFRHLKFHGLRHSSATYLLSNGCDIKTVSKRLGHTSIDTTNIYVHALERTDKAAAECFDSIEV